MLDEDVVGFEENGVRLGGPAAREGGGFQEDIVRLAQLLQRAVIDEKAVAFKKKVFDWEAQLLQKVVLDEEAVDFKITVFDWDSQLLQKAMLDEEAVGFKKTVFDWELQLLQ